MSEFENPDFLGGIGHDPYPEININYEKNPVIHDKFDKLAMNFAERIYKVDNFVKFLEDLIDKYESQIDLSFQLKKWVYSSILLKNQQIILRRGIEIDDWNLWYLAHLVVRHIYVISFNKHELHNNIDLLFTFKPATSDNDPYIMDLKGELGTTVKELKQEELMTMKQASEKIYAAIFNDPKGSSRLNSFRVSIRQFRSKKMHDWMIVYALRLKMFNLFIDKFQDIVREVLSGIHTDFQYYFRPEFNYLWLLAHLIATEIFVKITDEEQ